MSSVVSLFVVYLSIWVVCAAGSEHQNFILDGVSTILKTCAAASMSLLNEETFPILAGDNDGINRAHVAGVEWENGRIVAFSHTSFYLNDLPNGSDNDNVKLFINSLNWVRRNSGIKIGSLSEKQIENVLVEHGYEIHVLSEVNFNNLTLLEQFDVLVVSSNNPGLTNLRTYVRNGGGLLIGVTGWTSDPNEMESFWGNVLLQDTGIFYLRSYSYGKQNCNGLGDGTCFNTSMEFLQDTNAYLVWQYLKEFSFDHRMPRKRLTQMMEILLDRLRDGPNNETLSDEVKAHQFPSVPIIPKETAPVTQENEKDFIIAHKYRTILFNLIGATDNIPLYPAAEAFPGASVSTERVQETVNIDGSVSWLSTGLYAQPGDEIKIRALDAHSCVFNVEVQIGVHSDILERVDSWKRCPDIVFQNKLKNCTATIANPFGGPIYIVLSEPRNDSLTFLIEGGIRSPSYFTGKTNLNKWRNEVRNYSAPWGELVGRNLIITTQASFLSQLDNPEEVINVWDRIMDAIADLAAIPREGEYPSRFVADVQIGGGDAQRISDHVLFD